MEENIQKEIQLVGELFRKLFNKYNRIENKKYLFKDLKELTLIEINTILVIGHEKMKSMSEIANSLGVSFGTPTVTIDRLISKGYVERIRDVIDRRQVFVKLSEKGLLIYNSIIELRRSITEKIFSVLTPNERQGLITVLSKLNGKFDEVLESQVSCSK